MESNLVLLNCWHSSGSGRHDKVFITRCAIQPDTADDSPHKLIPGTSPNEEASEAHYPHRERCHQGTASAPNHHGERVWPVQISKAASWM